MLENIKQFLNEKSVLELTLYGVVLGFLTLSVCLGFILDVYHELQTGRWFILNIIIVFLLLISIIAALFLFFWILKFLWNTIPLMV